MRARRIIIGIVCTLVLLVLARRLFTGTPRDIQSVHGELSVRHTTVTEQVGPGCPEIGVTVTYREQVEAMIRFRSGGEQDLEEIAMTPAGSGEYTALLPDLGKGKRLLYSIIVTGSGGESVRVPARDGGFLPVKYKGHVSTIVLVMHIVFFFGAFFFMIQCFWSAVRILARGDNERDTIRTMRWAMIFTFVGGWPLGFILNFQAFGVVWEGYPFGFDITDNKTQVMFLFWIVCALLVRGSFFGLGRERDSVGSRGLARSVITAFVLSLVLFIVPHSL